MEIFRCQCDWVFVIIKKRKRVAGPFYPGPPGKRMVDGGSVMSYKVFKDLYGDCSFRYERSHT